MFLQVLDGLVTYCGVNVYGTQGEGNPIIRHLIELWGPLYALVLVKGIAILLIAQMAKLPSNHLKPVLFVLCFIYLNVVAIWIYGFWISGLLF